MYHKDIIWSRDYLLRCRLQKFTKQCPFLTHTFTLWLLLGISTTDTVCSSPICSLSTEANFNPISRSLRWMGRLSGADISWSVEPMSVFGLIFSLWRIPDLRLRGRVADGDGTEPDPDRVRRLTFPQDLPAPVRQLLLIHLLHRFLKGQVRGISGTLQQVVQLQTGGV